MEATALVYSSHDRCNYIHNEWIVQRALAGNKRILYLPMSEGVSDGDEIHRQEYGWSKFRWYFEFYRQYDLNAYPFYWNSHLRFTDVEALFRCLAEDEVVILGGGNPTTGFRRYRELGERFYGDADMFNRILHQRQARGLLTAGYSAGADQLCQYMASSVENDHPEQGFALCRNIMALSHFNPSQQRHLAHVAARFPHCLVFGIPNDSGIAVSQGLLPSGNIWQVIQLIIDCSWDYIEDRHHILTWGGMLIQHYAAAGRHWAFHGGDILVRITDFDNSFAHTFMLFPNGSSLDYDSRSPAPFASVHDVLNYFSGAF